MRIIKPSFEILTPIDGLKELQHIETIARTCYKSEGNITEDGESAKRMIHTLISRGHEAMIEHSTLAVKFIVDRGVSHELVRHRIASFAQESTRYCNYANDKFDNEVTFIDLTDGIKLDAAMKAKVSPEATDTIYDHWLNALQEAEDRYLAMIEAGATPQVARSVLPNSTKTEIVITANYREWRNFFKLRTPLTAHPQMREVTIPLLYRLQELLPDIFADIVVEY